MPADPAVAHWRKALVLVVLVVLVLFELYLLTIFLPHQWQDSVGHLITRVLGQANDQSAVTHPNLDQEVEQVLAQNSLPRILAYLIWGILFAGNTFLISRLSRALKKQSG